MFFFGWRFSGRFFNKHFTCVTKTGWRHPSGTRGRLVPAPNGEGPRMRPRGSIDALTICELSAF